MREDLAKVLCERERRGSDNKSVKTAFKLPSNADYESLDYDWGPTHISFGSLGGYNPSRRLAPLVKRSTPGKSRSPRYNILVKVLQNAARQQQQWNDVYSELCDKLSGPSVRKMVHGYVATSPTTRLGYTPKFCVDSHGILKESTRSKPIRRTQEVDKIHWKDLVYFERKVYCGPAGRCGCVHFKFIDAQEYKYGEWAHVRACIHGNPPTDRVLWEVVEYAYHQPDKVYNVCEFGKCGSYWEAKLGLTADNPVHKTYYRDVADIMAIPFVDKTKTANRKELKILRGLLKGERDDIY